MMDTDRTDGGSEDAVVIPSSSQSDEVLGAVRDIVAELIGVEPDTVTSDTVLLEAGADSFHFVFVVFRLQTLYGITLPREMSMPDRHTVGDFANAVIAARVGAPA
jgi:acyl carrier protein